MLGVGETDEEIIDTMLDLRDNGVEILTLGQYLQVYVLFHCLPSFTLSAVANGATSSCPSICHTGCLSALEDVWRTESWIQVRDLLSQ